MIEDRDITVAEAAQMFGIPRWQLYKWIRDEELFPVNVASSSGRKGRVRFFRMSEIADLAADLHEATR